MEASYAEKMRRTQISCEPRQANHSLMQEQSNPCPVRASLDYGAAGAISPSHADPDWYLISGANQ